MTKPKTPCYGCTERAVGCHARCGWYREYKEDLEAWKKETAVHLTNWPVKKIKKNKLKLS